jgi:2-polyprenyl-3-methyl-5-hydroxy-6-metoxy-1,4-benzoquinol methylase
VVDDVVAEKVKIAELRAIVEGIRDRVRAQYPTASAVADSGGVEPIRVSIADLMPIVHARDAAQAKMAAIGSVNPRAGGVVNAIVQKGKRLVARSLNWMVRDQIVFNRGALACVEATVESLNELNRAIHSLAGQIDARLQQDRHGMEARLQPIEAKAHEISSILGDLATQWNRSQNELAQRDAELTRHHASREHKLDEVLSLVTEHFRQTVAQYEARALAQEKNYADLAKAQHGEFSQSARAHHAEFTNSLTEAGQEIQHKLEQDVLQIKLEFERIIHHELRVVRQRGLPAASTAPAALDYQAFSDRFRGSENHVRGSQQFYLGRFHGEVLDIGCGQGEFLEVMREAGVSAKGIDQSEESIANCRAKGLEVEQADLFTYLSAAADKSLDGIFSSQVVEHLPVNGIPAMIQLCAAKLREGGLIAIETPNPACLAIFATHFYLDPTHVRPVPSQLLAFYLQESGFGGIEVVERFPASDSFPELNQLPEAVRNKFFGGLDYVIFAHKL